MLLIVLQCKTHSANERTATYGQQQNIWRCCSHADTVAVSPKFALFMQHNDKITFTRFHVRVCVMTVRGLVWHWRLLKIQISWDIRPCELIHRYRHFEGSHWFHLQGKAIQREIKRFFGHLVVHIIWQSRRFEYSRGSDDGKMSKHVALCVCVCVCVCVKGCVLTANISRIIIGVFLNVFPRQVYFN